MLARDLTAHQQLIDTSFPEHAGSAESAARATTSSIGDGRRNIIRCWRSCARCSRSPWDALRQAQDRALDKLSRASTSSRTAPFDKLRTAPFDKLRPRWPMPAVMSFLKTGLAGVTLLEADEIENYLIQHRLGGAAWDDPAEWAYQRQITAPGEEAPPLEVFQVRNVEAMRCGVARACSRSSID